MKTSVFLFFLVLAGAAAGESRQINEDQVREPASLLEAADEQALIRDSIDLKVHSSSPSFDDSPLQALHEGSEDALERFLDSLKFSDRGLASYYPEDLDQLDEKRRLGILRLFGPVHVTTRASGDDSLKPLERQLKTAMEAAMGGASQPLYVQYPDRTCLIVALQGGCAPWEGDFCSSLHCGPPIPGPGRPGDDQVQ